MNSSTRLILKNETSIIDIQAKNVWEVTSDVDVKDNQVSCHCISRFCRTLCSLEVPYGIA